MRGSRSRPDGRLIDTGPRRSRRPSLVPVGPDPGDDPSHDRIRRDREPRLARAHPSPRGPRRPRGGPVRGGGLHRRGARRARGPRRGPRRRAPRVLHPPRRPRGRRGRGGPRPQRHRRELHRALYAPARPRLHGDRRRAAPPTSRPTTSGSANPSTRCGRDLRVARIAAPRGLRLHRGRGRATAPPRSRSRPRTPGFFALGLALLQGITSLEEIERHAGFEPGRCIYVAPPFRHTHFEGRQVVVHNRTDGLHELFAYNLYPGPSAKKGIYGVLLNHGRAARAGPPPTARPSASPRPYDNEVVFMHEGASGGGKSEMLEHIHREDDGRLLLGETPPTASSKPAHPPADLRSQPGHRRHGALPARDAGQRRGRERAQEAHPRRRRGRLVRPRQPHHPLRRRSAPRAPVRASPGARCCSSTSMRRPGLGRSSGSTSRTSRARPARTRASSSRGDIVPNIKDGHVTVDVRSLRRAHAPVHEGAAELRHPRPVPRAAAGPRLAVAPGRAPRGHANPSIVDTGG
jgi:hypothetical protein